MLVIQSCLTLCNPKDCSPPGSSVHGILQARILEWVAMPFSRESWGSHRLPVVQAKEIKTLNLKPAKKEASVKRPPTHHPLLHPIILLTALMTLSGLWYNTRSVVLGSLCKQKTQSGRVLKKITFFSFFLSPSLPPFLPSFLSFFLFFFFATSYRILFPRSGMKPTLPALLVLSPSHWTAREVPRRLHSCRSRNKPKTR